LAQLLKSQDERRRDPAVITWSRLDRYRYPGKRPPPPAQNDGPPTVS